jgi:two-component system NtrC family sensor kinase
MKLVPKLTAALVAGTVLVLAVNGYLRIQRETELLRDDRVHNHALVGRALGAAVSAVWHSDGKADAMRVVEGANQHEGAVRIKWVDAADVAARAHPNADGLADLPVGETVTHIAATPQGDERFSYTAVALGNERVGFVELSETLDAERRAARTIVSDTLVTSLALVLVSGLLSAILGLWLVGRPVLALSAKARRIGEGDFGGPLDLPQGDELGALALEMNAMCDRLDVATKRAERETAARIATLEQLRHVDRLTTVGKLASGVAHELGTPLNVVSARAKMIASGETDATETAEYARIIAAAADRMAKIIRQLLAFARRKPTHKAPCDLRRIAGETIELVRPIGEKAHVRFRLADADVPVMAEVDGDAIQQVLTNAFVNAIHAMPKGGFVDVTMAEETRPPGDAHAGRFLVVKVKDEGVGIPPGQLPHIFEPFFTTKEVGVGTGLGLSVTHGIVEDHGGFIEVESEPDRGTLFAFYFPSQELAPPEGP